MEDALALLIAPRTTPHTSHLQLTTLPTTRKPHDILLHLHVNSLPHAFSRQTAQLALRTVAMVTLLPLLLLKNTF